MGPDGAILDTNAAWVTFSDLNDAPVPPPGVADNYLAVCDRSAVAGCEEAGAVAAGLRRILAGGPGFDLEYPCESPFEERWFLLQASPVPMPDGLGRGAVLAHVNITQRKRAEETLATLAYRDPLTALPNRAVAVDRLTKALLAAARTHRHVAVLFIDLDGFKLVNDQYGHARGDEVLVAAASRLGRHLRASEVLARFGGDEFVLICEDLADPADATTVAERVGEAMAHPFQIGRFAVPLGASVGVVLARPGEDALAVLGRADAAMYADKRAVRGDPSGSRGAGKALSAPGLW